MIHRFDVKLPAEDWKALKEAVGGGEGMTYRIDVDVGRNGRAEFTFSGPDPNM